MKTWWKVIRGERGLSLLELTVVAAILAVLAALTAVAVTGSKGASQSVAKTNDEKEVTKAAAQFSGTHSLSYNPVTLGSDSKPKTWTIGTTSGLDAAVQTALTEAGLQAGDTVYEIDWAANDGSGKLFSPDYIKKAKHAGDTKISIGDTASGTIGVWIIVKSSAGVSQAEAKVLVVSTSY